MTQAGTMELLSTLFEQDHPTAIDTTYIDALRKRWHEPANQAGLLPLAGLVRPGEFPRTYPIHPLEYWSVERVSLDELRRFAVPQAVREKLSRAYVSGMPIKWLLWAEQQVTPPNVVYHQETIYVEKKVYKRLDPALIALIKGGDEIGIPYLVHCWFHA